MDAALFAVAAIFNGLCAWIAHKSGDRAWSIVLGATSIASAGFLVSTLAGVF